MTQYYNFEWRDNQSAPYEFSPVIDGEVYFCEVGYSSGAGAFVLTVKSSFQEVVCIQNLVSSCDCGDIPLAPQLGFTDNFVFRGSSRCFEVGGVFRECPDFEQPITPAYYPPAYAIVPDTSTINETDSNGVTFTVTTANVPDGTALYYTALDITTEGAADLTPINGSVVITGNTGIFIISAIADVLTEGSEGFQCQLRTDSISGTVVATSILITILDTSIYAPTYAITPSNVVVVEQSVLFITINTADIPNGTTLYYTINNLGTITLSDFSYTKINGIASTNALSNPVVINSNTATIELGILFDAVTEPEITEIFTVSLRTGSIAGALVAVTPTITIGSTRVATTGSGNSSDSVIVGTTLYHAGAAFSGTITDPIHAINTLTFTATSFTLPVALPKGIYSITSDGTHLYYSSYRAASPLVAGTIYKVTLAGALVTSWVVPIAAPTTHEILIRYLNGKLYVIGDNSGAKQAFVYDLNGNLEFSANMPTVAARADNPFHYANGYYVTKVALKISRFNSDLSGGVDLLITAPYLLRAGTRTLVTDSTNIYTIVENGSGGIRSIYKFDTSGTLLANFPLTVDNASSLIMLDAGRLLVQGVVSTNIQTAVVISTVDGGLLKTITSDTVANLGGESYLGDFAYTRESANVRRIPII